MLREDDAKQVAPGGPWRHLQDAAVIFALVFAASLVGIYTRPVGFLAALWPPNALLLGVMVRAPHMARPSGWCAAFIAYVMADMVGGDRLDVAVALSVANLVFVGVGVLLYRRLPAEHQRLQAPVSPLYMFGVCGVAALSSAVAAMIVAGPLLPSLGGKGYLLGIGYWFSSELVNGILLVPLVLAMPRLQAAARRRNAAPACRLRDLRPLHAVPVLVLIASVVAAALVGGPGAIAFPIPALLWCALNYRLYTTIVLTLMLSVWQIIAASLELLQMPTGASFLDDTVSLRLGIALMALGPLTAASVSAARNQLVQRLRDATNEDSLTGALSRSALLRRGQRLVDQAGASGTVAALMLDIDHFKQVNDAHGHAGGDAVLRAFSEAVSGVMREGDLFGRLGGEEFAVVMAGVSRDEALAAAERVRTAVAAREVQFDDGAVRRVTVSIGLASTSGGHGATLHALLRRADEALYAAKGAGRDRVEVAG